MMMIEAYVAVIWPWSITCRTKAGLTGSLF